MAHAWEDVEKMRKNTALARMLAGEPAVGALAGLGSPLAVELLSFAGFDYVLIDNQHGVWDDNSSMAAFHNICLGPAVPMARVQQNDFGAIGRLLDRGALGIIVPLVNSVQEAEAAAWAARYPPKGGRSKGAFGAQLHGRDYYQEVNDEVFLAVQIESIRAVERAEEILTVEGLDGCWIGPADLAASMGIDLSRPKDAERHEAAILRVLEACRKTGKIPGIAAGTQAKRRIEEGFLFVTAASDAGYILGGASETLHMLGRAP